MTNTPARRASSANDGARRLTPAGVGGVAVIEVIGAASEERLARWFRGALPERGAVAFGHLADPSSGATLDEVLVVRRPDGAAEVHVHGSPGIVRDTLAALGGGGDAAPFAASVEELARRLVHTAASELGARILLDQAAGALRRELEDALALQPAERRASLRSLAARGATCLRLLYRTSVVLLGPVNAGKSTLFNVLVGEDAAAVTAEAGTTRDSLGARAALGPWPILLVDTAGERDLSRALAAQDPAAAVEAQGQALARGAAGRADLRIYLEPAQRPGPPLVDPGDAAPSRTSVRMQSRAVEGLGGEVASWPSYAIAAAEHPAHARERCRTAFERAFDLPSSAPWIPGTGVPFTPELIRGVQELAGMDEPLPEMLDSFLRDL